MKTPFVIQTLTAFVAVDSVDGDEGIIGERGPAGWMPFIGADEKRIRDLRPIAEKIGREQNIEIKLVRFSGREDLGTITPQPPK